VVAAADEIGNLWYAGYGAGINLTQFISLSLSGLLILITTVRDSLFEIPRAAVGRFAVERERRITSLVVVVVFR